MQNTLPWPFGRIFGARKTPQAAPNATTRFGGDHDDEPVFIGTVTGPIEIEMAKDALHEANIPALIKQSSVGTVYGFSSGALGSAEVWVVPALADKAYDTLVGMGLIEGEASDGSDDQDVYLDPHEP